MRHTTGAERIRQRSRHVLLADNFTECLGAVLSRDDFIAHQKVGLASGARAAIRGTSGTPRRTKLTRYRCSLPGLAGFAGNRRTEPEVPPIGAAEKFLLKHR
jgi:hypothetical protein